MPQQRLEGQQFQLRDYFFAEPKKAKLLSDEKNLD